MPKVETLAARGFAPDFMERGELTDIILRRASFCNSTEGDVSSLKRNEMEALLCDGERNRGCKNERRNGQFRHNFNTLITARYLLSTELSLFCALVRGEPVRCNAYFDILNRLGVT